MDIKEELEKVEEKVAKASFAMEMLQFSKEQNKVLEKNNKRMFIVILVLIGVILTLSGAFIYYVNTTGYEETTEYVNTDDGGNACVGDNCNNGEIDYGNSKEKNKEES
jgi:flagellar basal body-associated protein FliL